MGLGFFKVGQPDEKFRSEFAETLTELGVPTSSSDDIETFRKNIQQCYNNGFDSAIKANKIALHSQTDWSAFQAAVKDGTAQSKYPVGWLLADYTDKYGEILWRICKYGDVEVEDGSTVSGVWLITAYAYAENVQYRPRQALMNFNDGLAAGTYSFTLYTNSTATSSIIQSFTINNDIPAGGQMYVESAATSSGYITKLRSISFAESNTSSTIIETVSVETIEDQTDTIILDSIYPTKTNNSVNASQYAYKVSPTSWLDSSLRKYLNSSGRGWWTPIDEFDCYLCCESSFVEQTGFLDKMSDELKKTIVAPKQDMYDPFENLIETAYDLITIPSYNQLVKTSNYSSEYHSVWDLEQSYICPRVDKNNVPTQYTYSSKLHTSFLCHSYMRRFWDDGYVYVTPIMSTTSIETRALSLYFANPLIFVGG